MNLFPRAQSRPITVEQAWQDILIDKNDLAYARKIVDHRPSIAKWLAITPQGQQLSRYEPRGYFWNWARLDFGKVSRAIPKEDTNICHPTEMRAIGYREAARLASFPDLYGFPNSPHQNRAAIGNSVPPLFMYAIAAQIRHIMFGGPAIEERMNDYPAHLEIMWQKAIAPREPDAPTVVSTFAGGGGSLTGYLMAGYRDLLAVEWDDNAVATLRANYPDLDIYHGDIAKLTVEEVLKRTGLEPGQLDILDGSPPCQGFSTAGKRLIDDPRNQLFREYVRLLRGLRPKVFVMENVSGMVKGKMKLVFVEILKELKASGYRVSAKLLNAMYFHVPQSRERMIFIGVRDDLGIEPTHPGAEGRPVTVWTPPARGVS